MRIIILVLAVVLVGGLRPGTAAEPASTRPASKGNVVEHAGMRVTLLGVSSGVIYVGEDGEKAGDRKQRYVQAVFLVQGKADAIGQMKINRQPVQAMEHVAGAQQKAMQVRHARASWPGVRPEKIPEAAHDTDAIFEETYYGVITLPPEFQLSIEIGGRSFEFAVTRP